MYTRCFVCIVHFEPIPSHHRQTVPMLEIISLPHNLSIESNFITNDYYASAQWCHSTSNIECMMAQCTGQVHSQRFESLMRFNMSVEWCNKCIIHINNFSMHPKSPLPPFEASAFHHICSLFCPFILRIKCVNVRFNIYLTLIQFFIATFSLPQVITAYHLIFFHWPSALFRYEFNSRLCATFNEQ